ncbi:type II toxin-antitoxin system RelE family toxin [Mucilaginibacter sp. OK098]|uniref:type II toxin-antitoxin system RelE family toxin n=1 Tax=Mucilaginibacter sp. OK098 TaxID=1855297 RepID=UPI000921C226|nr:mRNA interferase RelE/StbE [Mucilaginibacter sp. OK098]
MPLYRITISSLAQKQLNKLQDNIVKRLIEAIYKLAENPRPAGYKRLKGRDGCRIRVGDYRIIYEIFDGELLIEVVALGHRKDIYN